MSEPVEATWLEHDELRSFCTLALMSTGLPREDATTVAHTLVQSDLRGVHTHGAAMLPYLLEMLRKGGAKTRPLIVTVQETTCTATLDGDYGLGQVVASKAMELAIAKAEAKGVGCVAVRHSNTFGAAAYYAMLALPHDMIGFATTNSNPRMAPWGGLTRCYANNPLSIAIPAGEELPIVLDMAHSIAAYGKVAMAAREGKRIPFGWALDKDGRPTNDPLEASEGILLPIGDYKGYGLALAMDILSGALSDGLYGSDIPDPEPSKPACNGHFLAALKVAAFTQAGDFKAHIDRLIRLIKASRLAEGFDRVYLPGEIEYANEQRTLRDGIVLSPAVLEDLGQIAEELRLEWPGKGKVG